MALNSAQAIFNVIRIKGSERYQDAVPKLSDKSPIGDVRTPIFDNPLIFKEFTSLLGAFINVEVIKQSWTNKLAELIKGNNAPLGEFSAVVGSELPPPRPYDPMHPERVLELANVQDFVSYYVRNCKEFNKLTLLKNDLMGAFDSYEKFNEYVAGKIAAQRTASQLSMYNHIFESIVINYNAGVFVESDVKIDKTNGNYAAWTVAAKNAIDGFQYPSTNYTKYTELADVSGDWLAYTDVNNIYIIATIDWVNSADVNFLATLFNIEKGELEKRIIKVPEFAYTAYTYDENGNVSKSEKITSDIQAVICDRNAFKYTLDLESDEEFYNPEIMGLTLYHHQWLTYGINPLANFLVFTSGSAPEPVLPVVTPKYYYLTSGDEAVTFTVEDGDGNLMTDYTVTIQAADENGNVVDDETLATVVTISDDESGTITVTPAEPSALIGGHLYNVLIAINDNALATVSFTLETTST